MTDPTALAEVERWFLSRGLPHFMDRYSASRDVFTRALPALTLILVLELLGALNFSWPWWLNVMVGVASVAALLAVWALANRVRKRPVFAPPDRVGAAEVGVFLVVPAALPLLAGGQRLTAINTLAGNVVLLTDKAYRQDFLHDVVREIRQAFAVRAAYLQAIGG